MYLEYYGLREAPFSIAPNPQYLYMSERHREALAHLLYGIKSDGGFILLTGEVGTGKTTVCRCLLEQIPEDVDTAFILNPKLNPNELLAAVCDDLHITYPGGASIKVLVDHLNAFLLASLQTNRRTVLIIDEAQNLSADVLEQLRLLTNLETNQRKLLQIILLGQPELLTMLAKQELRQLSQRVTARFHLDALTENEVGEYIQHRLEIAGARGQLFPPATVRRVFRITAGIPRLINLVCDRALLGTYVQNKLAVDVPTLNKAATEVLGSEQDTPGKGTNLLIPGLVASALVASLMTWLILTVMPGEPSELVTVSAADTLPAVTQDMTSKPASPVIAPEGSDIAMTDQAALADSNLVNPDPAATGQSVVLIAPAFPTETELPEAEPARNLETLSETSGFASQNLGFSELLNQWGTNLVVAPDADPCQLVRDLELECMSKLGSLRDIRHLDRPVLINLAGDRNNNWFVITRMASNEVELLGSLGTVWMDNSELLRYWSGFYSLLWKVPPGYELPIRLGETNPAVEWLTVLLARYDEVPAQPGARYDEALMERVKRFQISVGLVPDGVVGPQTWIHLNRYSESPYPRLGTDKLDRG